MSWQRERSYKQSWSRPTGAAEWLASYGNTEDLQEKKTKEKEGNAMKGGAYDKDSAMPITDA